MSKGVGWDVNDEKTYVSVPVVLFRTELQHVDNKCFENVGDFKYLFIYLFIVEDMPLSYRIERQ